MTKRHETSATPAPITSGEVGELVGVMTKAVLQLTHDRGQYWVGKKGKLERDVVQLLLGKSVNQFGELLRSCEKFYLKYFGIDLDLSNLRVPEKREGFDRLIVVAKGLTNNAVYDVCTKAFPSYKYIDNLNSITSDRNPTETYAIWMRDRVEADEELKGKSANDLKNLGIACTTFMERALFELKYFDETGKHLDIQSWTLCAGSRNPIGGVPYVHWFSDWFRVDWCPSGDSYAFIRAREAVV